MGLLLIFGGTLGTSAFGWGEIGHHLVATTAAQILEDHPRIQANASGPHTKNWVEYFRQKRVQLGHLSNIPDTYWKNVPGKTGSLVRQWGDPSHYLDSEYLTTLQPIPATFTEARSKLKNFANFYKRVGSLPWRVEQFESLLRRAFESQPSKCPKRSQSIPDSQKALTLAGLLSHFTGDAAVPFHTTKDYDGMEVKQKGLHSFYESELVNVLEAEIRGDVLQRARALLQGKESPSPAHFFDQANKLYKGRESAATATLQLIGNSFSKVDGLKKLDRLHAIALVEEGKLWPQCGATPRKSNPKEKWLSTKSRDACRRNLFTRTNDQGEICKTEKCPRIADRFKDSLIEQLAIASAYTADLWVRAWESKKPKLCPTWNYSFKPKFISPTDSGCAGYAQKEEGKKYPSAPKSRCIDFD